MGEVDRAKSRRLGRIGGDVAAGSVADEEHDVLCWRPDTSESRVGRHDEVNDERSGRRSLVRAVVRGDARELGVDKLGARDVGAVESSDRDTVGEVSSRAGSEDVVADGSTSRATVVDRAPDHGTHSDTVLDHGSVGEEVVVGNASVGESRVRSEVDHVDTAHDVALVGDDRVGVDERAGSAKDDDRAVSRVGNRVSGNDRVGARERDTIGPFSVGVNTTVALALLVEGRGRTVTARADNVVGDLGGLAGETVAFDSVQTRPSTWF